ncbi:hypothetical protein NL676_002845 [Syzygium grande]|nr:hypothetical protein NL676_002845 [Syzygium grande]
MEFSLRDELTRTIFGSILVMRCSDEEALFSVAAEDKHRGWSLHREMNQLALSWLCGVVTRKLYLASPSRINTEDGVFTER